MYVSTVFLFRLAHLPVRGRGVGSVGGRVGSVDYSKEDIKEDIKRNIFHHMPHLHLNYSLTP